MNSPNDLLEFTCPHCSAPVTASPELAGQRIQCGQCEKRLKVPGRPRSSGSTQQGPYGTNSSSPAARAPDPIASPPLRNDIEPEVEQSSSAQVTESDGPLVQPSELDAIPDDMVIESTAPQSAETTAQGVEFAAEHSSSPKDSTDRLIQESPPEKASQSQGSVPSEPIPEVDIVLDDPLASPTNELGLADLSAPVDLFGGSTTQPKHEPTPSELKQEQSQPPRPSKPPQDLSLEDMKTRFSLKCPVCDSVLYASMGQIGAEIKCDDCFSLVLVNAPNKSADTHYVRDVMSFDKDEYTLQPIDSDDEVANAVSDAFLETPSLNTEPTSSVSGANTTGGSGTNATPDLLGTESTSKPQDLLEQDVPTLTNESTSEEDDIFFDIKEPEAEPLKPPIRSTDSESRGYGLEPIVETPDAVEPSSTNTAATSGESSESLTPIEEGIDLLAPPPTTAKGQVKDFRSNENNAIAEAGPAMTESGVNPISTPKKNVPTAQAQSTDKSPVATSAKSAPAQSGWGQAKPASERIHELTGEEAPNPDNVEIDPPAKIRLSLSAADLVTDSTKIMMHPSMIISLVVYTMLTFIALSLVTTFRLSLAEWNETEGMGRFGPIAMALVMAICAAILSVFTTVSFAAIGTRLMRAVSSQDEELELYSEMGPWETLIDSLTLLISSAIALTPGMLIGSALAAFFGHSSFWCIGFVFYFFLVPFPLMCALRNENPIKLFDVELYDSLREHSKTWMLLFAVAAILTPFFVIAAAVHPFNSYFLNVGIAVVVTPLMFFYLCVVSDSFNVIGNQISHAKRLKEMEADAEQSKDGFLSKPKPISSTE